MHSGLTIEGLSPLLDYRELTWAFFALQIEVCDGSDEGERRVRRLAIQRVTLGQDIENFVGMKLSSSLAIWTDQVTFEEEQ